MSQGSASEIETELLIAFRLGYLPEDAFERVMIRLDEIGRMITGLCKHLRAKSLT